MKKIIFLLTFLILLSSVKANVEWEQYYSIDNLPILDTASFNFSLTPNSTISITEIQNDGRTTFIFPSQIVLNDTTSIAELVMNYSIPFFINYTGNETLLENIFGITNTLNSNLVLLKIRFRIQHTPIININTSGKLIIGKGVDIISFAGKEFNTTHRVTINAPLYTEVNITCGDYLDCPIRTTAPYFDVKIHIPKTIIKGNYSTNILLQSGNKTGNRTIYIFIKEDTIYDTIMYGLWNESCYDTPEQLAECYKAQARYNSEVANALLERLKNESNCEMIYNETTRYVEIGNIDPILFEEYNSLRDQYNKLAGDYTILSDLQTSCINTKEQLNSQITGETENLSNEFILKRSNLEKSIEEEKRKVRGNLSKMFLYLTILGIILMFTIKYMENQWMIQSQQIWIGVGLTILFFICWIIATFFFK